MLSHIALHVLRIISDVVDMPILKAKDMDLRESPVAKYLKNSRIVLVFILLMGKPFYKLGTSNIFIYKYYW